MVRSVILAFFLLAIASGVLGIRACSNQAEPVDLITQEQMNTIAVLDDGSLMFAPQGTITRALTDWLEQPDGDARWFELGGTQFIDRSIEPTALARERLPRLAKMLMAYPHVTARLVGHAGATKAPSEDLRLSKARAQWVMQWLVSQGIPQRRLSADGVGSDGPLFARDSSHTILNDRIALELKAKD